MSVSELARSASVPARRSPLTIDDLAVAPRLREHPFAGEVTLRALAFARLLGLSRPQDRRHIKLACRRVTRLFPEAGVERAAHAAGWCAWARLLEEQLHGQRTGSGGDPADATRATERQLQLLRQGRSAEDAAGADRDPLERYLLGLRDRALALVSATWLTRFAETVGAYLGRGLRAGRAEPDQVSLLLGLVELAGGFVLPAEVVEAELLRQLRGACRRAVADGRLMLSAAAARGRRADPFEGGLRRLNQQGRRLLVLGALVASELAPNLACLPRYVEAVLGCHRLHLEELLDEAAANATVLDGCQPA